MSGQAQPRVKKKRKNWSKGENFVILQKARTYYRLREDEIGGSLLKMQLLKAMWLKSGQNSTEILCAEICLYGSFVLIIWLNLFFFRFKKIIYEKMCFLQYFLNRFGDFSNLRADTAK